MMSLFRTLQDSLQNKRAFLCLAKLSSYCEPKNPSLQAVTQQANLELRISQIQEDLDIQAHAVMSPHELVTASLANGRPDLAIGVMSIAGPPMRDDHRLHKRLRLHPCSLVNLPWSKDITSTFHQLLFTSTLS